MTKLQALGLSWVAGAVDGIGFLLLHVFTAHVTGNTVHLGTDLGRWHMAEAARFAFAIAAFAAGVALGASVRERCRRRGLPGRVAVLALSAVLVAAFCAVGALLLGEGRPTGWRFFVVAAPAALAMGCQNAAAPRVADRRVRTFITGTITELAEALVTAADAGGRRHALRRAGVMAAIWAAYLVGAVASGAAATAWGSAAGLLPLAGLVVAVGVELRRSAARRRPAGS